MALLGQAKVGLGAVILTVVLGLNSSGEGVKQELWFYTEEGNGLYFNTHIPDFTNFSCTLPEITRFCMVGVWEVFVTVDYEFPVLWAGNTDGSLYCHAFSGTTDSVQSLRYFAANDSSTDAISLYTGNFYDGEEIFVTAKAKTDISIPIGSLAISGNSESSEWMLHEGKMLDGKSVCYKIPTGESFNYNRVQDPAVNLATIGSFFKGCDAREIQLYKDEHFV